MAVTQTESRSWSSVILVTLCVLVTAQSWGAVVGSDEPARSDGYIIAMNNAPQDSSLYLPLKKRQSPGDYFEGYIAGLTFALEAIDKQLQAARIAKWIAQEMAEKD